ncbi:MAG: metal-dependent transcriptional regulator [Lentisphaerota bacterium]
MESYAIDNLSVIQQEYIETIYMLCRNHEHAHTKDIADKLNVKMPSVVDALQSLAKMEMINYETRQPVTLTQNGQEIAVTLNARHKALADFFNNVLGFDKEYSDKTACSLEHVIDEKLKSRICAFNSFLKNDEASLNIVNKFKDKTF